MIDIKAFYEQIKRGNSGSPDGKLPSSVKGHAAFRESLLLVFRGKRRYELLGGIAWCTN